MLSSLGFHNTELFAIFPFITISSEVCSSTLSLSTGVSQISVNKPTFFILSALSLGNSQPHQCLWWSFIYRWQTNISPAQTFLISGPVQDYLSMSSLRWLKVTSNSLCLIPNLWCSTPFPPTFKPKPYPVFHNSTTPSSIKSCKPEKWFISDIFFSPLLLPLLFLGPGMAAISQLLCYYIIKYHKGACCSTFIIHLAQCHTNVDVHFLNAWAFKIKAINRKLIMWVSKHFIKIIFFNPCDSPIK